MLRTKHQTGTSTKLAPVTHRNEFRRGIPWRVALQQSPPPLPSLISVLSQWPPFDQQFAANGEPSTTQLSQERAQTKPQKPQRSTEIRRHTVNSSIKALISNEFQRCSVNAGTWFGTKSMPVPPLIGGVQPMRYVALRGRNVSERPCRWVQLRSNKQTRNLHAMRSGILSNFRFAGNSGTTSRKEFSASRFPDLNYESDGSSQGDSFSTDTKKWIERFCLGSKR